MKNVIQLMIAVVVVVIAGFTAPPEWVILECECDPVNEGACWFYGYDANETWHPEYYDDVNCDAWYLEGSGCPSTSACMNQ